MKVYIIGFSFSERKIKNYLTQAHAEEDSTTYMAIDAENCKEAKQIFSETHLDEDINGLDSLSL